MSDFGACKGCGRVYSLTRLKACPRCGEAETNIIEEVRIPTTVKNDLTYQIPETADETDLTDANEIFLPATTPCKNCGRDFRSDKLGSCPRCGHQDQTSDSESNSEFRCDSCSNSFPQAFDFCPSCGNKTRNSIEKQKAERLVNLNTLERHTIKIQPQSIPLSEQRQAKNNKVKQLVFTTFGIFILLLVGALVLKGISAGSPSTTGNEESVDSNQGTVKIVKKCYIEWLPNPAYDPSDFLSNETYAHRVCQFVPVYGP